MALAMLRQHFDRGACGSGFNLYIQAPCDADRIHTKRRQGISEDGKGSLENPFSDSGLAHQTHDGGLYHG